MAVDVPKPVPRQSLARAPRAVLMLTLGFTILATCLAGAVAQRREWSIFERETEVSRLQIMNRLQTYVDLLRGAASLFASSPDLTRAQFGAFVEHLRTEDRYPGARGVGYAAIVSPEEGDLLVQRIRAEGFTDFHLWPEPAEGSPRNRTPIIYIAPEVQRQRKAMGFDVRSDPKRAEALDEARDQGQPRATGQVQLVRGAPETPEPGFLVYVPVYRTEAIPQTIAERRTAIQGYVFGAFSTREFLDGVRKDHLLRSLSVEVYDGLHADASALLYNSGDSGTNWPALEQEVPISVAGHTWTARFAGGSELAPIGSHLLVPAIAGTGLVMSLILFAATLRLSKARAEAELSAEDAAHNQRLFERIAAASPDVLYLFDLAEQRILYVNREVQKSLGYTVEQIRGLGASLAGSLIHPDDRAKQETPAATFDSLADGDVLSQEMRLLHANGTYRWFLTRSVIFSRTPEGKVQHVLGLGSDVTERRETEEALRAANEAKDKFLATLSHELRTPLTPVLAVVSDLEKNPTLDMEIREDVAMVRRNVELEARLIDDLLDLTRIARGKLSLQLQPTDVREIAEHCANSVVEMERKGIHFTLDWRAREWCVMGDRSRLIQVFWNLLKNAAKFTHQGGHMWLRSHEERDETNSWLVVECEDDGIGIDPKVLPGIFKAFEQGSREITRRFGGLGLGLAISRAIVEAHGGRVEARSEGTGCGAIFSVRLPLTSAVADAPSSKPEEEGAFGATKDGYHILLVEDHVDTAEILTKRLRRFGYHVTHVADQNAALAAASKAQATGDGERIDLVLSDLGLPDGSGFDLMKQLSTRYGLHGIALSGYGMERDVHQSAEAGFEEHLVKPVDLDQLRHAIEKFRAKN